MNRPLRKPRRFLHRPRGFAAVVFCGLLLLHASPPLFSQVSGKLRTFAEVFPGCGAAERRRAFSPGAYRYYGTRADHPAMIPKTGGAVALSKESLGPNPVFFVEALQVIPGKHTSLLRIYNALEQSKNLAGRLYHSATRNRDIPLFEEAVRIEGPDKIRSALPDPPPAAALPSARENYIRLKDANFGACYYAISFATDRRGIRYRIQNFKPLTFGPFPVMKAQGFTALFYLEPVEEGLALYCLVGAEVSDFIGRHVNMSSALDKRLDVLIEWLLDGIR